MDPRLENDVLEREAADLVELIASRRLSSRELVQAHLDRIEAVDGQINAIVTLDAEGALEAAARADEVVMSGAGTGPLHGLPMTHKDTHATAGMRTTQGSPLFADHIPDADDPLIGRLKTAGVISTGKSNVPEFAAGSHTFNEVFGATRNPYDLTASAGGSSGGLGAALAARIQPLGEGSDMGGSLRIPASYCNVYGFRPSYGVIPSATDAHRCAWLARQGPMARTVRDLQLFMRSVCGPSDALPFLRSVNPADFSDSQAENLRGVRIGMTYTFGQDVPVEPEMLAAVDRAAATLTELGAHVEEAAPDFSGADEVFHVTRAFDFATALGETVRENPDRVKPEVVWNVDEGFRLDTERLIRANAASAALQDAVQRFFSGYDLLLSPGAQLPPFDVTMRWPQEVAGRSMETYLGWMRSASLLSATGLPTVAMPAGFTGTDSPRPGLPTGVQLTAGHYADATLLWWARAYDSASGWSSTAPGMLSS